MITQEDIEELQAAIEFLRQFEPDHEEKIDVTEPHPPIKNIDRLALTGQSILGIVTSWCADSLNEIPHVTSKLVAIQNEIMKASQVLDLASNKNAASRLHEITNDLRKIAEKISEISQDTNNIEQLINAVDSLDSYLKDMRQINDRIPAETLAFKHLEFAYGRLKKTEIDAIEGKKLTAQQMLNLSKMLDLNSSIAITKQYILLEAAEVLFKFAIEYKKKKLIAIEKVPLPEKIDKSKASPHPDCQKYLAFKENHLALKYTRQNHKQNTPLWKQDPQTK